MKRALLTCLLLTVAASPAAAQARQPRGTIDGAVTDTALAPVPGALVSIDGTQLSVSTSRDGRFRIVSLPAGSYLLRIRKLGYAPVDLPVDVAPGDTARPAVILAAFTPLLDPLRTTAPAGRIAEFEQRRALGKGQFLTEEDIRARNPVYVDGLLRTLRGVALDPSGKAMNARFGASRNCYMAVIVDDVVRPATGLGSTFLSPSEIAGIEVYVDIGSVPMKYSSMSGAACGVIVVWTKRGTEN
jgi:hypothetical protein